METMLNRHIFQFTQLYVLAAAKLKMITSFKTTFVIKFHTKPKNLKFTSVRRIKEVHIHHYLVKIKVGFTALIL